jgi:hypothetical protein
LFYVERKTYGVRNNHMIQQHNLIDLNSGPTGVRAAPLAALTTASRP